MRRKTGRRMRLEFIDSKIISIFYSIMNLLWKYLWEYCYFSERRGEATDEREKKKDRRDASRRRGRGGEGHEASKAAGVTAGMVHDTMCWMDQRA